MKPKLWSMKESIKSYVIIYGGSLYSGGEKYKKVIHVYHFKDFGPLKIPEYTSR